MNVDSKEFCNFANKVCGMYFLEVSPNENMCCFYSIMV